MREDCKEWLYFVGKMLFWISFGAFTGIWKVLKFLNCLVTHPKYHYKLQCGEFWQFGCEKCGVDTEARSDSPPGVD